MRPERLRPGANPARQEPADGRPDQEPRHWAAGLRRTWWLLALLLMANWIAASLVLSPTAATSVPYSFFRAQAQAGNVVEVTATGDAITGTLRTAASYTPKGGKTVRVTSFKSQRPAFADDELIQLLLDKKVTIIAKPAAGPSALLQVLVGFGPTLLIIGLLVWFLRRSAGMAGGLGGLGRSRAKLYDRSGTSTTFDDVAGIDEVEQEVMEIVHFLREPARFAKVGAKIPHGVLLYGPPGTGKTLLARAVAGEAQVPFFSMSASEFIEMIVGVGASRVRDLFAQAKQAAPAIIFIDELDAIGRARGSGLSLGGHDEREQTLDQILNEMDGFTGAEGVVVLAATNRPEILDQALLRPGRFDRRVAVNPPDQQGREAILRVHTRSVPLAADVDLAALAASTPGMVGADLKNLVNEAALQAAKGADDRVSMSDFTDALEKVVLGAARHIMLSVDEKRRTAFHESGHALLGMLTVGADAVRKVSIIPRGQALGVTLQSPQTERYAYPASYLRGRIVGAMGGRAAEQVVFGDTTTGVERDLEQATAIARQMVGRWGMSTAIGPVSLLPAPDREQVLFDPNAMSAATAQLVDDEVRRILDSCYAEAVRVLTDHRPNLDSLAAALLAAETLDEAEAHLAAGLDPLQPTTPTSV